MSKLDRKIQNFGQTSPFKGYSGNCLLKEPLLSFSSEIRNMRGQLKFATDMNKNRKSKKRRKK